MSRKPKHRNDLPVLDDGGDVETPETLGGIPVNEDRWANEVLGVFPKDGKFDRERSDANAELIGILAQYLTDHPNERFGQALRNLEIVRECLMVNPTTPRYWENEFNTEPQQMVARAKRALRRMEK